MDIFRNIAGWVILLAGIGFIILGFFMYFTLIYGVLGIIIGILLLINFGREEKIEKIKRKRK